MFKVTPIPAFQDNYIWAISIEGSNQVVVVDPGDNLPVEHYLQQHHLHLNAILVTHHHYDHTDGIAPLVAKYSVPVYGPANTPFTGITIALNDHDQIELLGHQLQVRTVPGHTLDHIAYFSPGEQPQLFCGDTLFLAGCGRLFEGTAAQMLTAMNYFKSLPDNTAVYCTHEYSLANLQFASAVEPDSKAIQKTTAQCNNLRENNKPTLPTSIAQERLINPFMRTTEPEVITSAIRFAGHPLDSELDVFTAVREWKNQF
ncbi:MAG: hydroxyacylglutathione hydrolase [Pontibacterium sp.]